MKQETKEQLFEMMGKINKDFSSKKVLKEYYEDKEPIDANSVEVDQPEELNEASGSQHQAIHKFNMFSLNYPNDFIEQIWGGGNVISDHLKMKFDHMYDTHGSKAAMLMFWTELDSENRRMLQEYVIDNYAG